MTVIRTPFAEKLVSFRVTTLATREAPLDAPQLAHQVAEALEDDGARAVGCTGDRVMFDRVEPRAGLFHPLGAVCTAQLTVETGPWAAQMQVSYVFSPLALSEFYWGLAMALPFVAVGRFDQAVEAGLVAAFLSAGVRYGASALRVRPYLRRLLEGEVGRAQSGIALSCRLASRGLPNQRLERRATPGGGSLGSRPGDTAGVVRPAGAGARR